MASPKTPSSSTVPTTDPRPVDATERILQEITAVGRCLEAMDLEITDLSTASTFIQADIASFQDKVTDLDLRLTSVEGQLASLLSETQSCSSFG
ncbi:hypothetical protein NDU88_008615 [Pleurodeles waltl]|uniref:Uncharacterized protein n=1 Tax=Pleurodeles waltl TaxID=8319 RepID=A0AAV7PPZ4_PLEWA|nr:hypothetical protein NDU88_008615 [Pleurodeles waltl]